MYLNIVEIILSVIKFSIMSYNFRTSIDNKVFLLRANSIVKMDKMSHYAMQSLWWFHFALLHFDLQLHNISACLHGDI